MTFTSATCALDLEGPGVVICRKNDTSVKQYRCMFWKVNKYDELYDSIII